MRQTRQRRPTATAAPPPAAAPGGGPGRRSAGGLAGKLLPELQQLAGELGISGTARMRKSELIAAIQERQGGGASRPAAGQGATSPRTRGGQRAAGAEQRPDDQP